MTEDTAKKHASLTVNTWLRDKPNILSLYQGNVALFEEDMAALKCHIEQILIRYQVEEDIKTSDIHFQLSVLHLKAGDFLTITSAETVHRDQMLLVCEALHTALADLGLNGRVNGVFLGPDEKLHRLDDAALAKVGLQRIKK